MNFEKILKTRMASVVLVLLLAGVVTLTSKLLVQKLEVRREIKRLEAEAQQIQNENQELTELMKYLETPEYKEKQAREKLNLAREGEQVVVLPESIEEGKIAAAVSEDSNPKKWFKYFFGNN